MWEERGRSAEIGGTQFHSLANHRGVLPLSSWLKKSTGSSRTSSSSSGRPSPHIQTSGSSKNYWEANWSRPCMDAAHWHQGLGLLKPMEEMLMGSTTTAGANQQQVQGSNPNLPLQPPSSSSSAPGACGGAMGLAGAVVAGVGSSGGAGVERKARPQKEKALNCPRCNSTNTKFCYYNNYSLQQPRYFCKTCRRYWTEGGSLRNVPVGGGSRKNKRSSSSSSSANAAAAAASASVMASSTSMSMASKNPKLAHEGGGAQHDLNLAFPHHVAHGGMQQQADQYMAFPSLESSSIGGGAMASGNNNGRHGALSAMELLRSTGCYMPSLHVPMQMPGPGEYGAAGFSLGEFRAAPGPPQPQSQGLLGFSLDAHGGPVASAMQGMPPHQDRAGRMLFPFEDLKPTDASGSSGGGGGDESGAGAGGENGGHRYEQAGSKEQGNGHAGGHDTAPGFWNGMIGGGTSW